MGRSNYEGSRSMAADGSNPGSPQDTKDAQDRHDRTQELEARVKALSMQHAAFRDKVAARLEEKNRTISQYEEQLQSRGQDKGQTDAAAEDAARGAAAAAGEVAEVRSTNTRLQTEVSSLKKSCASHSKERRAIQVQRERERERGRENGGGKNGGGR